MTHQGQSPLAGSALRSREEDSPHELGIRLRSTILGAAKSHLAHPISRAAATGRREALRDDTPGLRRSVRGGGPRLLNEPSARRHERAIASVVASEMPR
jgi:hypothetical protein